jgi:hypothetical protein
MHKVTVQRAWLCLPPALLLLADASLLTVTHGWQGGTAAPTVDQEAQSAACGCLLANVYRWLVLASLWGLWALAQRHGRLWSAAAAASLVVAHVLGIASWLSAQGIVGVGWMIGFVSLMPWLLGWSWMQAGLVLRPGIRPNQPLQPTGAAHLGPA